MTRWSRGSIRRGGLQKSNCSSRLYSLPTNTKPRPQRRGFSLGESRTFECPLLAQSGRAAATNQCPLLGAKRTSRGLIAMSAFDPKRTSQLGISGHIFRLEMQQLLPRHYEKDGLVLEDLSDRNAERNFAREQILIEQPQNQPHRRGIFR
jgi:hypothetical protein